MSSVKNRLRSQNREAMERMANVTVDRMRAAAPVGTTGNLGRGIGHTGVQETGSGFTVTFFSEEEYSSFQDKGTTGPYLIFPNTAKVLRFSDGGFSAHAMHPGVPRTGYFSDNLEAAPELLQEIVEFLG